MNSQNNKKIGGGLQLLKKDNLDFSFGKVFGSIPLEELPDEFIIEPLNVKNQLDTDYCTAMATCGMSEIQEGVPLCPEWSFAVSGDPEVWGRDMRAAMKAHVKIGAIKKSDSPFSLETKDDSFLRDISNWPEELFEKAKEHRKQSYFKIDGPYDSLDNIRSAMYMFRDKKRLPGIGVLWSWDLYESIIPKTLEQGIGHMVYAIGWKKINDEIRLIIQNSYGKEVGDNGRHYFPREVINEYVDNYGSFMFVDINPEKVKQIAWSPCQRLRERIKKIFSIIWE